MRLLDRRALTAAAIRGALAVPLAMAVLVVMALLEPLTWSCSLGGPFALPGEPPPPVWGFALLIDGSWLPSFDVAAALGVVVGLSVVPVALFEMRVAETRRAPTNVPTALMTGLVVLTVAPFALALATIQLRFASAATRSNPASALATIVTDPLGEWDGEMVVYLALFLFALPCAVVTASRLALSSGRRRVAAACVGALPFSPLLVAMAIDGREVYLIVLAAALLPFLPPLGLLGTAAAADALEARVDARLERAVPVSG